MSSNNIIRTLILGGGGHAKVVIDSMRAAGALEEAAILDPDPVLWGHEVLGVPVLGGDELLPQLVKEGAAGFIVGLGAVGNNRPRQRLFELGLAMGLNPLTVRHPSAICSPSAQIGGGSVVLPSAVINPDATLGVNVIVNTGAIVEHDCVVGDHVHLATGSRLCSTVRLGDGSHIGAGATVRQVLTIGEGAVVGAGAVVVRDVPPWTTVVGVPARELRRVGTSGSSDRHSASRGAR